MAREICPVCEHYQLVSADGPKDSKLLLVGEYPGVEEIKTGHPWVGEAGQVLNEELERAGLNRDYIRVTNLWLHAPPAKPRAAPPRMKLALEKWTAATKAYDAEFRFHYTQLLKEMVGRKGILLMGSDVTEALLGVTVTSVAGCFVKSDILPKIALAMMNPAIVFRSGPEGTLGETRMAIRRWAEAVNEANLA